MCVACKTEIVCVCFTDLIVTQVWRHRRCHPSVSLATASAGASALGPISTSCSTCLAAVPCSCSLAPWSAGLMPASPCTFPCGRAAAGVLGGGGRGGQAQLRQPGLSCSSRLRDEGLLLGRRWECSVRALCLPRDREALAGSRDAQGEQGQC